MGRGLLTMKKSPAALARRPSNSQQQIISSSGVQACAKQRSACACLWTPHDHFSLHRRRLTTASQHQYSTEVLLRAQHNGLLVTDGITPCDACCNRVCWAVNCAASVGGCSQWS